MARPIITVHGDHSNDEETRLGALSDDVRFDVLQGSWRHDALSLDRYPNNPLAPQYTAVPAAIPALALGVLRFGPDTGFVWFAQDSMPSAQRLNKIAVGVDASDINTSSGTASGTSRTGLHSRSARSAATRAARRPTRPLAARRARIDVAQGLRECAPDELLYRPKGCGDHAKGGLFM